MKTYGSATYYEPSDYGLRFDWAGFFEHQRKWLENAAAGAKAARDKEEEARCPAKTRSPQAKPSAQ
jgi:hypothetical protein